MPTKTKTSLAERESNASEANEEESVILVMNDGQREFRLDPDELGPGDDLACRQQTGIPLDNCLSNPFGFGLVALIWVARRKSGEPNLAYQQVAKNYPTYKSMTHLEFKVMDRNGEEVEVEDGGANPLAVEA